MTTVGTGKHTYTLTSDWAKMPDAHPLGAVSALASDSAGDIYAFHRADPPIAIFDRETGNFKSGWGNGGYAYAHGFYIEDDIVYLTDRDTSTCMMYTLDGKIIQMLGRNGVHSDTGCEVAGALVPRAAGPFNYPAELVPSPSGDLYVADGYRNARIHRFDNDGRLKYSWGKPGKEHPYEFHLPHSLLVTRGRPGVRLRPGKQSSSGLQHVRRFPGDVDRYLPSHGHRRDPRGGFRGQPAGAPGRVAPAARGDIRPGRQRVGPLGQPLRPRHLVRCPRGHFPGIDRRPGRGQIRPRLAYRSIKMDLGLFYQIQVPKPWDDESETRKFQEMMEQVCFAEEIGMTSVWFVEHHFRSEWSHSSAPDITLAALSQRTTNMRLGIAVVLAPLHHPLNVASRMATLDVISGGRVDLGIGRSGYPYQMLPYGSDLADVSEMVEEYLQIIPGAWTEESFGFEGKHYQIPPREVIPKPVQKPASPDLAGRQSGVHRGKSGAAGLGVSGANQRGTGSGRGFDPDLSRGHCEPGAGDQAGPSPRRRQHRWPVHGEPAASL